MPKIELKPIVYMLYWTSPDKFGTGTFGIFSSVEAAKTEAARYNHKKPLVWQDMTTDDKRIRAMFRAPLSTWHSKDCYVEIVAYRLDSRAFRP